jgi:hypothetical protein
MYAVIGIYHLLKILLALITAFNLEYYLVDITNTFLNTVLDKEVYIKCPPGFKVRGYI